jgi:hypothetical protein
MRLRLFLILFTLLLFGTTQEVKAQAKQAKRFKGGYHHGRYEPFFSMNRIKKHELWSVYATLGYAAYYGDLCDGWDCHTFNPSFAIGFYYRTLYLDQRVYIKTELRYLRLSSDDQHEDRNLDFKSNNFEFYVGGSIDLYGYQKLHRRRKFLNPYFFAGIGIVTYNPYGSLNGEWYRLRDYQTEQKSYGSVGLVVPLGFGLKIKYTPKISFALQAGYRFTFIDYLDDVSQEKYPDAASFSDPTAAALSYKGSNEYSRSRHRGNPDKNDGYYIFSVGVVYTFTNKHAKHTPRFKSHLLRK